MQFFATARILIVDDEAASMQALCDTLQGHGYATAGFTAGEAALHAMRAAREEGRFDLLLTDLMMPGMNGVELLSQALEIDPELVGIVMTGQGSIATAVEAMKVGAFDYVLKPFKLSVILPVLTRALAVRQLRLEKASLEENLRERTAALEAANRELEAFSYSISHDLRSPLRAIDGFARMLEEDYAPRLDHEGMRLLAVIRESSSRMGELIDNLLAFSRLGEQPVQLQRVDMQALAAEAWNEVSPGAAGAFTLGSLPAALGDPALLRQVWVNLLSNAAKFSGARDRPVIEVHGHLENQEVVYSVRDNGAGFDMRQYKKLFGVFQRLHSVDEFPGTGVGLAFVQRIVLRHGGRIWAEGKTGEGASFHFALPVAH